MHADDWRVRRRPEPTAGSPLRWSLPLRARGLRGLDAPSPSQDRAPPADPLPQHGALSSRPARPTLWGAFLVIPGVRP